MNGSRNKGLRFIDIDERYRSDRADVVSRFYIPAFSSSTKYSRAVGYFTSASLVLYAEGLDVFLEKGGVMRLIASPNLDEGDIADISRGYSIRDVINRATLRELDDIEDEKTLAKLGLVGQLIADGRLDIKLAFVVRNGQVGIYHEKIGVFRDEFGDLVSFTGSSNETLGGLVANFESIEVYKGWTQSDGARALRIESDFEELWENRTQSLSVESFPEVARDRLVELGRIAREISTLGSDESGDRLESPENSGGWLRLPGWLKPRDYQDEAVRKWLENNGRGIFSMATGTGKTKTSLLAATAISNVMRKKQQALIVIIIAPLQHLVDQWIAEVETFGVGPVGIYESSRTWIPQVEDQINQARLGQRPVVAFVATNKSFADERFQEILSRIPLTVLLIGDEVHNLGSATYRKALPGIAHYRLGLSATPDRWHDEVGTQALVNYFGPIVFELGLGEAIEMGALCRYTYHPRLVELDATESEYYAELTKKIARCIAAGDSPDDADSNSPLGSLLRKRAAVLGHAAGKLAVLKEDLQQHRDDWYQLIYCAEGNRPGTDGEDSGPNQIREVMQMVGNPLEMSGHPYIAETSRSRRKVLLRRFSSGSDLQTLLAMRCLDEGVDIPDARIGYILASSSNPRQFIQRRGRLLRLAEGKTHAKIYDYLAVPRPGSTEEFGVERALLVREFERANEFAQLADNYGETLELLAPLREHYQLMDT